MKRRHIGKRRTGRGFVVLALAAILILAVAWALFSGFATGGRVAEDRVHNAQVLQQAKQALIGWAAVNAIDAQEGNPGRVPCPEAAGYFGIPDQEGKAAGSCTQPKIGRLPWRTLGLPKLLDASGEPLWYVTSPGWALPNSTATLQINSNSPGQLTVDGQSNAAVALIIAPGGALNVAASANCAARNQSRGTAPPDFRDYLECENASASPNASFATGGSAGSFNDQVLAISAAEILPGIEAAIAKRIERDLAAEFAKAADDMPGTTPSKRFYPFAAIWSNPADFPNDPARSPYVGTIAATQGLLPLMRSRKLCGTPETVPCAPGIDTTLGSMACDATPTGDAHCDAGTANSLGVQWNVSGGIKESERDNGGRSWKVDWKDGGRVRIDLLTGGAAVIGQVNCSPSSASLVDCRVQYGYTCSGNASACPAVQPSLTLTVRTTNAAGRAFRRINTKAMAAFGSDAQFQPGGTSNAVTWSSFVPGAADITTEWRLRPSSSPCNTDTCGSDYIRISSSYLDDNVMFQSRLRDAPAAGQRD
ncbi:MAG: hypothetical protein OEW21_18015, partial [Betaproteobacteria bacterium]|nr:hypothetical protein [Betaproteobacteria bacterium]